MRKEIINCDWCDGEHPCSTIRVNEREFDICEDCFELYFSDIIDSDKGRFVPEVSQPLQWTTITAIPPTTLPYTRPLESGTWVGNPTVPTVTCINTITTTAVSSASAVGGCLKNDH